jgi:hypothetical protein
VQPRPLSSTSEPTHQGSYIFNYVDVKAFSTLFIYYPRNTVAEQSAELRHTFETLQLIWTHGKSSECYDFLPLTLRAALEAQKIVFLTFLLNQPYLETVVIFSNEMPACQHYVALL